MIRRLLLVGLAPMCWPLAGSADDCPGSTDLIAGVQVREHAGTTVVFRRFGADLISATYSFDDGSGGWREMLAQGLYVIETVDILDGAPDLDTRHTYSFGGADPADLVRPEPGQSLSYDVDVRGPDLQEKEVQVYTGGGKSVMRFGACTYDAIEIELRYESKPEQSDNILYYLPRLGIAYWIASIHADGTREDYTPLSITAAK